MVYPVSFAQGRGPPILRGPACASDRKSTRLNSSHLVISYAVFCLKKKNSHRSLVYAYRPFPVNSQRGATRPSTLSLPGTRRERSYLFHRSERAHRQRAQDAVSARL